MKYGILFQIVNGEYFSDILISRKENQDALKICWKFRNLYLRSDIPSESSPFKKLGKAFILLASFMGREVDFANVDDILKAGNAAGPDFEYADSRIVVIDISGETVFFQVYGKKHPTDNLIILVILDMDGKPGIARVC